MSMLASKHFAAAAKKVELDLAFTGSRVLCLRDFEFLV